MNLCYKIVMDNTDFSIAGKVLARLDKVGLKRGKRWLLRDVDLTLKRGEVITLVGPNGAGKSTLAKLLLGVLAPDEGKAQMASGLAIGYVPQQLSLDPALPLSVERLMCLTFPLRADDIARAFEKVGIGHLAGRQVHDLSGGEFQRLLLARAIARKPDLLVLDEPAQGVDFAGEIALYDLIADIGKETGCGILLVSHDLHIVMAASNRVICLNGHICCQGAPKQVAADPAYQALFGSRSLAFYQHQHDHQHD